MANPYSHLGVTDEEYSDYGSDFLSVIAKLSRGQAAEQARAHVGHQHKAAREAMITALDGSGIPWRKVNDDQRFIDDCNRDPYPGGGTYMQALTRFWNANDTQAVLGIFDTWIRHNRLTDDIKTQTWDDEFKRASEASKHLNANQRNAYRNHPDAGGVFYADKYPLTPSGFAAYSRDKALKRFPDNESSRAHEARMHAALAARHR